jgi:hypothetical protein
LAIFQHFGLFSSFSPLSIDLAPDVRFRQTWCFRKSYDVYFSMAQILYHYEFRYLIGLPRSKWAWRVTWGPVEWHAWTHCHGLAGLPLPRVWNCVGYYLSLALRQFGGLQHLPRIDDLSPMTFEYLGGTPMWEGIERVTYYWSCRVSKVDFMDLGSPSEEIVTPEFIRWREKLGSSFLSVPPSRPAVMTPSARTSLRDSTTSDYLSCILDLDQEL